jgi:predicted nucleic acid-binding protein
MTSTLASSAGPLKLASRFPSCCALRRRVWQPDRRWRHGWHAPGDAQRQSAVLRFSPPLMNSEARGPVLVVDASCLCEVLIGAPDAETVRQRLALDDDHAAPHIVDVEVFSVVRREHRRGRLDRTAATQAVEDLEAWPGERFGHRLLLSRAWELRDTVRGWDAMYVALAEALDAVLVTTDRRLAAAPGPACRIEMIDAS